MSNTVDDVDIDTLYDRLIADDAGPLSLGLWSVPNPMPVSHIACKERRLATSDAPLLPDNDDNHSYYSRLYDALTSDDTKGDDLSDLGIHPVTNIWSLAQLGSLNSESILQDTISKQQQQQQQQQYSVFDQLHQPGPALSDIAGLVSAEMDECKAQLTKSHQHGHRK